MSKTILHLIATIKINSFFMIWMVELWRKSQPNPIRAQSLILVVILLYRVFLNYEFDPILNLNLIKQYSKHPFKKRYLLKYKFLSP